MCIESPSSKDKMRWPDLARPRGGNQPVAKMSGRGRGEEGRWGWVGGLRVGYFVSRRSPGALRPPLDFRCGLVAKWRRKRFANISHAEWSCCIYFHTFPHIFIHFHIFSCIFINFHIFSYISIYIHIFPHIFLHFHLSG